MPWIGSTINNRSDGRVRRAIMEIRRDYFSILAALLVAATGCQRRVPQPLPTPAPSPAPPPTNHADVVPGNPPVASSEVDTLVDQYEHPQLRAPTLKILEALSRLNSEEALAALGALFSMERDSVLQEDILEAMSEITSSNTVWAVAKGLDAALPTSVRLAAIEALEDVDDAAVIPRLQGLLTDPNPEIQKSAAHAIDWLQTPMMSKEELQRMFRGSQKRKQSLQNKSGG